MLTAARYTYINETGGYTNAEHGAVKLMEYDFT